MSIVRSFVLGGLSAAALLLPACGGQGPQPTEADPGASAAVAQAATTAKPATDLPPVRPLTLRPRTPQQIAKHAARKTRSHVVRKPSSGVAGSNFTDPTNSIAASFSVSGGDEIGHYAVANDANSSDSAAFQGGPVIQNLHFQIIFWGSQWATATTSGNSSSQADIQTAVSHILQTTYLDDMKQYGWQTADVRGFWNVPSDPPTSFQGSDVADMVQGLIDQGSFPEVDDPGGDNFYMVFMPQLANFPDPTVGGAHGTQSDYDFADVDWLLYGFVNFGSLGATTGTFTHEMVESISDPSVTVSPGWIMDRGFLGQASENEIGDACNHTFDFLDGILVEGYFSQAERACVIPFPAAPTITNINPDQGPESGGQQVTITGTGFDPFGGSTQFTFGGVQATGVHCSSTTSCTMTTPPGNGTEKVQASARYFKSANATYLYGPGAPNCSASYACTHNGSGAATITCLEPLSSLSLQRLNGGVWQADTGAVEEYSSFIDYDYPAPGTTISYRVTETNSFGSATGAAMNVTSLDCACSSRAVCELANGTQIYPQVGSPSNWCQLRGGHWVTQHVCP
jgi:hypothetical protein